MEDLQSILLPGIDSKRPIIIAGPCSAETALKYFVQVYGSLVPNRADSKV